MVAFRGVQHLNLNVRRVSDYGVITQFRELRSLMIRGWPTRAVSLQILSGLRMLERVQLTDLIMSDVDLKSQIDRLLGWDTGALRYRNRFTRGDPTPRWRTAIDKLA